MGNWSKEKEEEWQLNNNFRKFIGIQVQHVEDGRAVLQLPVTSNLLQRQNNVHGGIYSVLIDSALGTVMRTAYPEGVMGATVELNLNYLRSASDGVLIVEGRLIKSGRTLFVGAADVFDENNKLLATGRGTFFIRQN